MSDDIENTGSEDQQQEAQVTENAASPDRIAELEAALTKATENLEKARKGERHHKKQHEELKGLSAEAIEWKQRYESLSSKVNEGAVNAALAGAISPAEAGDNMDAILALIDRSGITVIDGVVDTKALEAAVADVKKKFPPLFTKVEVPDVKRSGEGSKVGGREAELRAAKTMAEYQAVLKKHGLS